MKRLGSNLISTLTKLQEKCEQSANPLTFEQLDYPFGFVLYSKTLENGGKVYNAKNIRDYGYVYVNNDYKVR